MLAIEDTLVSEEVLEKKFVCDLNACKGGCCVKGDYGAPLEDEELPVLEKISTKSGRQGIGPGRKLLAGHSKPRRKFAI